jgi:hypothetical protein
MGGAVSGIVMRYWYNLENSNLRIYDVYPVVRVRYVSSREMAHIDKVGQNDRKGDAYK